MAGCGDHRGREGESFNEDKREAGEGRYAERATAAVQQARRGGGEWWNWIGERDTPNPERPVSLAPHMLHMLQTGDSSGADSAPEVPSHTLFMHGMVDTDRPVSLEHVEQLEQVVTRAGAKTMAHISWPLPERKA